MWGARKCEFGHSVARPQSAAFRLIQLLHPSVDRSTSAIVLFCSSSSHFFQLWKNEKPLSDINSRFLATSQMKLVFYKTALYENQRFQ